VDDTQQRDPLEKLAEQFASEHRRGLSPTIEDYAQRYPQHAGEIRDLFPALLVMEDLGTPDDAALPTVDGETLADWSPPDRFGDYEIVRELGRGGMGVVYEARQRSLGRRVALKVLPFYAVSDSDRRERFQREAQAAARLDHSHIVPVFEVGEQDGYPFFSMKLIEGTTLDDKLKDGPLEPREAAAILLPVALAIEGAHQRGVLHRDLKPSNILIDAEGEPQVTDFGLAKLFDIGSDLSETNASVGTPSYMAPEQAEGKWKQIGVRTDVYGLGAVLYHCLTARPPFQAAMAVETLRQVVQQEPVSLRQLNSSIDRDAETICLKCLSKEPARRYSSAKEVAGDLQAYLEGRPIKARPLSTVARTVRWCRRRPWQAASLVLLVATLMVACGAWFITEGARRRAEESHRQTRQVVDDLLTRISEEELLNEPGMQPLRRDLLEKAREHYQRFVEQRGDDAGLRAELADAHFRLGLMELLLGRLEAAEARFDKARDMQSGLVAAGGREEDQVALSKTLTRLGEVHMRRDEFDAAAADYAKAEVIRRELVDAQPANREYGRLLANAAMHLGLVQKARGDYDGARKKLLAAETRRRELLKGRDDLPTTRDLGKGLFNLGGLEVEAAKAAQHPGDEKNRAARLDDAEAALAEAADIFARLVKRQPQNLGHQYRLAECWRVLAEVQTRHGGQRAAERYARAYPELERLALENPGVLDYQVVLGAIEMSLAREAFLQQQRGEALAKFREAARRFDLLTRLRPNQPAHRENLALCLRSLGEIEAFDGKFELAREHLQDAGRLFAELAREKPERPDIAMHRDACQRALQQIAEMTRKDTDE
jgi:tetratricopeptide (TPR) repeat protein/predicted Ser/Thr protein kinase